MCNGDPKIFYGDPFLLIHPPAVVIRFRDCHSNRNNGRFRSVPS